MAIAVRTESEVTLVKQKQLTISFEWSATGKFTFFFTNSIHVKFLLST